MLNKIGKFIVKEIKEALPPFIFFLFLFHMISLTKAVSLGDYSITALRATASTVGALIVAKAILLVEALPIARMFTGTRIFNILWKSVLFASVALLFRIVEEIIPLISKHGGILAATDALVNEISWPIFWISALWILGGLVLYCLTSEIVRAVGSEKVKEILFEKHSTE